MLPLLARRPDHGPLRLLTIGAHADDIEIGCGGTILKLIEQDALAEICWIVLTGETTRAAEASNSAHDPPVAQVEHPPERAFVAG